MCCNMSVAGKCQAWMTPDLLWVDLRTSESESTQEVGINLKAEFLPEGW